jgi:hypothetical protein
MTKNADTCDTCEPRYYCTIVDTSRLPTEAKLLIAAIPGGVIEQEKRGQEELVGSNQLPTKGLLGEDRARWEALGVKILDDGGPADRPAVTEDDGCVCAACGHEQATMDPCESCGSVRTVLISVVRREFGENWRDAFKDETKEPA